METKPEEHAAILDLAWKRVGNFSAHSARRKDGFYDARRWIAILSVLVTLIAILTELYQSLLTNQGVKLAAQILFIATPVLASTLAAFASKKYANGDWWVTRAAAEEIKKEIYFYRTIWPKADRNRMLEESLEKIQRQVFRALGGVYALEEPKPKKQSKKKNAGEAEPEKTAKPAADSRFSDLTGDDYFEKRVVDQLNWHNNRINQLKRDRDRMTILIMAIGALGTVLATLGSTQPGANWGIWVALTASITSALIGWEQLRSNEAVIRNYSKVVLELSILRDRWLNLMPEQKAKEEKFKELVNGCEKVLWAQNTEYIRAMQDVHKDDNLDEQAKLANTTREELVANYETTARTVQESTIQVVKETAGSTREMVEGSYQATLASLQEDGSQLLQKQLDAVGQSITEAADHLVENVPTLKSAMTQIAQDYPDVEVGRDTSKEDLNEILSRYPKTGDLKG